MSLSARNEFIPFYQSVRFFVAPKPLLAVSLMALNDHWLKFQYPGWVTGKLSDFAGLYFTPIFLLALVVSVAWLFSKKLSLQQMKWGTLFFIILVDSVFIMVKTSPAWGEAYRQVVLTLIGSVSLIQDPSDLWALLMSPLSYRQAVGDRNH